MKKDTKLVGICVSQLDDPEYAKLVDTICRGANENGYRTMIFGCFAKMDFPTAHSDGEASIFREMPMEELTVLVLLGQTIVHPTMIPGIRDAALEKHTPVITVDYEMEGCFNIRLDYLSCFRQLVRHVIGEHHCQNPYFMAGYRGNAFSEERLQAYIDVMHENNLPVNEEHIGYGDFWSRPTQAVCRKWMEERKEDLPDAVICANDEMALTVINVLEEYGLRVPDDVIVTGFDGIDMIQYCTPRLSTGKIDHEEIVRRMMEMIRKVSENPDTTPYTDVVPFHLLPGESCGCLPVQRRTSNQYVLDLYSGMKLKQFHTEMDFQLLMKMTEGHSVLRVFQEFGDCFQNVGGWNCQLFVNADFCRHTDILLPKTFGENSVLLVYTKMDGESSVPMTEVENRCMDAIPDELWQKQNRILYLPLHWQADVYGYLAMEYEDAEMDYERLKNFMMILAQILGTARNQSQLYEMYIRDALTGLYNRRGFYGELANRLRAYNERPLQILLVSADLDHLKEINDHYGHSEGDIAICAIADALTDTLGESGICARFGGDEYVAVRLWKGEDAQAGKKAEEFQGEFQSLLDVWNARQAKGYTLGASMGLLMGEIWDINEIDELIKKTDNSMYDCKERHHSIRSSRRDG